MNSEATEQLNATVKKRNSLPDLETNITFKIAAFGEDLIANRTVSPYELGNCFISAACRLRDASS